ncbi:MAG: hypothetical protein CMJ86_03950 [Planctomycetes bacterium]|nr:hypothetical protein [Planctomycetota bacterium]
MTSPPKNPAPFPPFTRHSSERIYDSPWCGLRRDMVTLPSGELQEYHVLEIGPAVTVVPVLPDGRVLLIGQYRYPHGKTHWELPAGRLEPDEEEDAAARRELLEETGYAPDQLLPLPGFYPTNGISAHHASAFVATGCKQIAQPTPDSAEQITVGLFTREEVEALLDAGQIQDAFAALPLLYWLRGTHLQKNSCPAS